MLGIRFYENQAFDSWQGDISQFACDVCILAETETATSPASILLRASTEVPWASVAASAPRHVGISFRACGAMPEKALAQLRVDCEQGGQLSAISRVTFIVSNAMEHQQIQAALETHFAETPSWLS